MTMLHSTGAFFRALGKMFHNHLPGVKRRSTLSPMTVYSPYLQGERTWQVPHLDPHHGDGWRPRGKKWAVCVRTNCPSTQDLSPQMAWVGDLAFSKPPYCFLFKNSTCSHLDFQFLLINSTPFSQKLSLVGKEEGHLVAQWLSICLWLRLWSRVLGSRDQVPHRDSCMELASPSACVSVPLSASLMNK